MRWPFGKLETRDQSYVDTLVSLLVSRAQGRTLAVPAAIGALEACAGVVGRGFASAEVAGRGIVTDALTPQVMELVGRSLIRAGEVVFLVDTTDSRMQILPCETWDVEGGPFPDSWVYRLTLGGPSKTLTYDWTPASSVLHFRYAYAPLLRGGLAA